MKENSHYQNPLSVTLDVFNSEYIIQATQPYINGNHGKQHSGCEVRWLNAKISQRHASLDAGPKNLIDQRPGSNSQKPIATYQ